MICAAPSTSPDGSFRCAVLAGDLKIYPAPGGRPSYELDPENPVEVSVENGETARVDLFLVADTSSNAAQEPAVSGRVLDPDGRPVRALVALSDVWNGSGFVGRQESTVSGVDGSFAFARASSFPVRLVVAAPGRRLAAEALLESDDEARDLEVRLRAYASPRIEGTIVTKAGYPIPQASVLYRRNGDDSTSFHCGRADATGRFFVDNLLPRAAYEMAPAHRGRFGKRVIVRVREGETTAVQLVLHEADALLTGVVEDRNGRPVDGVTLRYDCRDDLIAVESTTVTGPDGVFRESVIPGQYWLAIDDPRFGLWWKNVETDAGPVSVVLARNRLVRFSVRSARGLPMTVLRLRGSGRPAQLLGDSFGKFEAEIPETDTEIRLEFYRSGNPPEVVPLDWPAEGILDLGTIVVRDPGEGPEETSS